MEKFTYELAQFVKLNCGCQLHENSGELYKECMPHSQANFMQ
ncbi:MAG: hypothetical protein OEW78_06800 [Nitrosopumilus sp.]|nr:hypothetical protein [Nitrosopumilus sp.]MDH5431574.1 hypothetical protein [Nitrosopumilus sp.]